MNKLASIEVITAIEDISGFDNIQLATVAGYQTVVPKNKYSVGEYVIYVAIDSVLPDTPEFEPFKKYAAKRVKTARIGNKSLGYVWSQGLVLDICSYLPDYDPEHIEYIVGGFDSFKGLEGTDVSTLLGITKYEEPQPQELNAKGKLPFGIPKTDEDRYQSVRQPYLNEIGNITLKIDGTSFTAAYHLPTDTFAICGRTLEYKQDCNHKYSQIATKYDLANKLKEYCIKYNVSLALRGEIYGQSIQKFKNNWHSKQPLDVAFYSVWNIDKGDYERIEDTHYVYNVCDALHLPTVPLLAEKVILTKEILKDYETFEKVNIDGNLIPFEGIVVTTDSLSFKVINKFYDMNK